MVSKRNRKEEARQRENDKEIKKKRKRVNV